MSFCFYTVLSLLFLISMAFVIPPSSSKNLGFQAPLIHKSSPASPFYNPKAKRSDLIRASSRSSLARSNYINSRLLGNTSSSLFARGPIIYEFPYDYVMPYFIGTPPIKTYGFLDTGSDLVWLQCQPCTECFDQIIQPIFNPRHSSTYENVSCIDPRCFLASDYGCFVDEAIGDTFEDGVCTYSISYMDDTSSEGFLSTETITLPDNGVTGNNTITDMVFGCGFENVERDDRPHPSGIIGLANTSLSLVSQLHVTKFSYCVVANDTTDESHGWIRFGLPAVISGASTPLFPNKYGYHFIKFEGISLTGDWLNISMEPFEVKQDGTTGFMIDSGTTDTFLHANAYNVLLDEIRRYKQEGGKPDHDGEYDLCFDDLRDAPEIEFHFKSGASFPLSNDNTWIENSIKVPCLAIKRTYGVSMLGMWQQRNMNVGYDYSVDQVAFTYDYTCPENLF